MKDSKFDNRGLPNLVGLRPVNENDNYTTTATKVKPTRTINISEQLYRRFVAHSKKFYNVESFETILENLLTSYEENHRYTYHHNTS